MGLSDIAEKKRMIAGSCTRKGEGEKIKFVHGNFICNRNSVSYCFGNNSVSIKSIKLSSHIGAHRSTH